MLTTENRSQQTEIPSVGVLSSIGASGCQFAYSTVERRPQDPAAGCQTTAMA